MGELEQNGGETPLRQESDAQKGLPAADAVCFLALMSFLPIVGRELRVAARRRSTFWVRVIAALVALVIGAAFLVMTFAGGGALSPVSMGRGLFLTLTWLTFAAALASGLFLTSDCLSEEKREGTIGFLFLTDLAGYDVVLGKLLANSVRGFFALLAVFPILAVTLLMGGVTGVQFWKTVLALLNALVVSLAAGMFVSAISREAQKALTATIVLLGGWLAIGPAVDGTFAYLTSVRLDPGLKVVSPGYLFMTAGAWGTTSFWLSLFWNQLAAWSLLGLACVLIRRTWQDKTDPARAARRSRTDRWSWGGAGHQLVQRRQLIARNPVLWLACRERWQSSVVKVIAVLLALGFVAFLMTPAQIGYGVLWNYGSGILIMVLYVAVASQASRFFVETRRTGLLELMLGTPMTVREIVRGQWRGLIRLFGAAVVVIVVVQGVGNFMVQRATWSQLAATPTAAPAAVPATPGTNNPPAAIPSTNGPTPVATGATGVSTTVGKSPSMTLSVSPGSVVVASDEEGFSPILMAAASSLGGAVQLLANLAALCWFGMWMGMTSKSLNAATLKTIAFVQIIPWFAFTFLSALLVPILMFSNSNRWMGGGGAAFARWYPFLFSALSIVLFLAKDLLFIFWSRRVLHARSRERAGFLVASPPIGEGVPVARSAPPPLAINR